MSTTPPTPLHAVWAYVTEHPGDSAREIAWALGMTVASVTDCLDALAGAGYIAVDASWQAAALVPCYLQRQAARWSGRGGRA